MAKKRGKFDSRAVRWEPIQQMVCHAPPRAVDVVVGDHRSAAERAAEVEVVEPAVEAVLVEDVAAREPAHAVPAGEAVEAHRAVGVRILVGAAAVDGELVAEDDEAGEAGADDGDEVAVGVEGRRRGEEAEVVEEGED